MSSRILQVVAAVALLAGCANSAQIPTAATADCGFHFNGGSGLLGLLGAMGAFERPTGPDCRRPMASGRQTPQVLNTDEDSPELGTVIEAPHPASGQTVYSPHECVGAVVMGECHGSILPDL
jgi:hypothetical protein